MLRINYYLKLILIKLSMSKDINKYWDDYQSIYSFEDYLKIYREQRMISFLEEYKPKTVLEIGCGFMPGFLSYKDYQQYTIIEPGIRAFKNAKKLATTLNGINLINNFFEESYQEIKNKRFDCIVSTGVLHETKTPDKFLKLINSCMNKGTKTYINVPNAKSLHKLIAKEMGIIDSLFNKSDRNIKLEQTTIYDAEKLKSQLKKNIPGIKIRDCSSFFLKPFTHDQMMSCLNHKIINNNLIDALNKISDIFPENGCELACIFGIE